MGAFRAWKARLADRNTIWTFREHLKKAGVMDDLFAAFEGQIMASGYHAAHGHRHIPDLMSPDPSPLSVRSGPGRVRDQGNMTHDFLFHLPSQITDSTTLDCIQNEGAPGEKK